MTASPGKLVSRPPKDAQVTFKVSEAMAEQLDELGASHNHSRHASARFLVERALNQREDRIGPLVEQLSEQAKSLSVLLKGIGRPQVPYDDERLRKLEAAADTTHQAIGRLAELVAELRRDVATSVCGILVHLGKAPQDAERWARKALHLPD
jgi:hypothetical protein